MYCSSLSTRVATSWIVWVFSWVWASMRWTVENIVAIWIKNVGGNMLVYHVPLLLWLILWQSKLLFRDLKVVLIHRLLHLRMVKMVLHMGYLIIIILFLLFILIVGLYTHWNQLIWRKPSLGFSQKECITNLAWEDVNRMLVTIEPTVYVIAPIFQHIHSL